MKKTFHMRIYAILFSFCFLGMFNSVTHAQALKVEIIEQDGKFFLLRDGKPYDVRGVGLVDYNLERLAAYGANSVRTWSVDNNAMPAMELLDKAHELGLTVSLGLEFGKERLGFDYNDSKAVAEQLERTKERVMRLKDHPALLMWIIGNELNFDYENSAVFDAVNDAAKMIKAIDPHHPVTTPLAGFDKRALKDIQERAPALDFVSFQLYADLVNLPKYVKEFGYKGPYMVTEWGAVGHWEVFETKWGAPVENTSSEKAQNYAKSFLEVMQKETAHIIGNYVFLWGQKQERTPTWYGMFLASGEETEAVDIMHYIWNGAWPSNRVPRVSPIVLDKKRPFDNVFLFTGEKYEALIKVVEPDNDQYTVKWEIRPESTSTKVGGDKEYVPPVLEGLIVKNEGTKATILAPKEPGAYRLFAYIYDNQGNAAHANFPFYAK